jgi:cbb3-type cytochrome oxidase subunit 3
MCQAYETFSSVTRQINVVTFQIFSVSNIAIIYNYGQTENFLHERSNWKRKEEKNSKKKTC